MGLLDGFLDQLGKGDTVKDRAHASKLFVGDKFALAPKLSWLYHVYFDLNPNVSKIGKQQMIESGMLVKSIDLPKFTIDAKTLNSYNKPNIVQNKIKYDPINIAFHDDHSDVVRNMWFDYYNYYYRDADAGFSDSSARVADVYNAQTKYSARNYNNFGLNPRSYAIGRSQYINSIRIYSLHQKKFSEYTLINPIITSFKHGAHASSSTDPLQHEMTISYEFVLYAYGTVSSTTVAGFADLHYDKSPSPLTASGGTRSILGPGGLMDTADSVIGDLSDGNLAGALFKSYRGLQNAGSMNLKAAALGELTQFGMDMLRGNNPMNRVAIPNMADLATSAKGVLSAGANELTSIFSGAATSNGSNIVAPSFLANAGTELVQLGAALPIAGLLGNYGSVVQIVKGTAVGVESLANNIALNFRDKSTSTNPGLPNSTTPAAADAALAEGTTIT